MESNRAGLVLQLVIVALLLVIAFELGSQRQGNNSDNAGSSTDIGLSTEIRNLQTAVQGLPAEVQSLQTDIQSLQTDIQTGNHYLKLICDQGRSAGFGGSPAC